ncbi:33749_t:CDS:2, partial [Racocetra persica]
PEDAKKKNSEANENISDCEDDISTTISEISISNSLPTNKSVLSSNKSTPSASSSTSKKRQTFLDNCIICQLSEKDNQYFENLILHMIVSTKLNEDILEYAYADGGVSLIWNTYNISNQWSKTENIKILIKSIMDNAENKSIRINCYISDLA